MQKSCLNLWLLKSFFLAGQPAPAAAKSRAAKSKAKAKAKAAAAAGGVQEVKAKTMDELKAEICFVLNFWHDKCAVWKFDVNLWSSSVIISYQMFRFHFEIRQWTQERDDGHHLSQFGASPEEQYPHNVGTVQ